MPSTLVYSERTLSRSSLLLETYSSTSTLSTSDTTLPHHHYFDHIFQHLPQHIVDHHLDQDDIVNQHPQQSKILLLKVFASQEIISPSVPTKKIALFNREHVRMAFLPGELLRHLRPWQSVSLSGIFDTRQRPQLTCLAKLIYEPPGLFISQRCRRPPWLQREPVQMLGIRRSQLWRGG